MYRWVFTTKCLYQLLTNAAGWIQNVMFLQKEFVRKKSFFICNENCFLFISIDTLSGVYRIFPLEIRHEYASGSKIDFFSVIIDHWWMKSFLAYSRIQNFILIQRLNSDQFHPVQWKWFKIGKIEWNPWMMMNDGKCFVILKC